MSTTKLHSLPNQNPAPNDTEFRKLYSGSFSQLRKRSEFAQCKQKPSPFNIRWIYGYNAKVGVINLNNNGSTIAFYAASNCGVLYNWTKHQMLILQGHKHMVTNIAISGDGKWLVTADSGAENVIIIWDSVDYFPQRVIFNPHGCLKLAKVIMSSDAKYLLTLAYQEKAVLNWWIWSLGIDFPHASLDVNISRCGVIDMSFNPSKTEEFILVTKHELWIGDSSKVYVTEKGVLKDTGEYQLKVRMIETKPSAEHGRFTCYTVVKATSQILIGTCRGCILVYGNTIEYSENVPNPDFKNLRFIKTLKVENKRITVIKSIDGVIVTGNSNGEIKFYDNYMRLLYWLNDLQVDSVRGLSFNLTQKSYKIMDPKCKKVCPCWSKVPTELDLDTGLERKKLLKSTVPSDATTYAKPFLVRDFIICTHNQGVAFLDFLTEKKITIIDNKISAALTVTVHPDQPFICVGYAGGVLELYNYVNRKLFLRFDLADHYKIIIPPSEDSLHGDTQIVKPQISVTCLKYSPSGLHLACGLDSGELIFLHPSILDILSENKATNYEITQIEYSCDSLSLVTADKQRTVCVYKFDCSKYIWNFIGKHRAHYKDITSVFFLPEKNESGDFKLISLGLDRIMVEYDIDASLNEYLEIYSVDRVDQTAIPLVAIPWPTPANLSPEVHRTDLPLILIANDEFKYKIVNYGTTMTLSTILGPRYEHPVCRMKLVSKADEKDKQYIVFATRNVIGLQKLPLDGNPWKHVGQLGHPLQILDMCFHEDSGNLFTVGLKDSSVIQWTIDYKTVDSAAAHGGVDLDPYYCLVENGRPGWLFQEIRDLFYYIQILCQGTFSPAVRRVKDYIPIDSLPDLMRTLGFFLSEYEVENLLVEAKYKVYGKTPSSEIDFDEFVKLYLNHRPAFGESFTKIRNAFRHFAESDRDTLCIDRDEFIDVLCNNSECYSRELAWYLLSILCGNNFLGRRALTEGDFSFLPEKITLDEFIASIMGIHEMDLSDASARESVYSMGTVSSESVQEY